MSAWQTIDSAPKDGTRILVFTIHGDVELSDWFSIPRISYEPINGGDTFRKVESIAAEGWNSNEPTHWQPLPEPPEAT